MFGQLTAKQMAYMSGGAGFVFVMYATGGFFLAIVLGGPVALLAAALAFIKINERPFYLIVYAWFFYMLSSRLYLWKKNERVQRTQKAKDDEVHDVQPHAAPRLSQSRLKELAWSLDTKESMYTSENQWKDSGKK